MYNHRDFVADAVGSVLDQTYDEIECIVVDDGSTDGSGEMLRHFDGRVRLIRQENAGVASARNAAIRAATGSHVAFLDSDDLWLPHKLELQMDAFRAAPDVGLVYSGFHVVDSDLSFVGRVEAPDPSVALRNSLLLEDENVSVQMTGVVRRDVIDVAGLYDENLSTCADCDFVCRVLLAAPCAVVARPLALYRLHAGQMHGDPRSTETELRYIFDKLFSDPAVPAALRGRRRRAEANLAVSLAWAHHTRGDQARFLAHTLRALLLGPGRVLDAARRMTEPSTGINRSS
jgi:glycosyltransferase involved in cell wall biosynthesis